jgi:hypothetical protein
MFVSQGYFFLVGVIANVMSYYMCWVWLIRIHFQIIDFNILNIGVIFCNTKNIKSQELWTFEIEKLGCNANYN